MTNYPTTQGRTAQEAPVRVSRPGTVLAAGLTAMAVGLAALLNGLVVMLDKVGVLTEALVKEGGVDTALAESVAKQMVQESEGELGAAFEILQNRSYVLIASGALLLLFGFFLLLKAAVWSRVLVTLTAIAAAGFSLIVVTDVATSLMGAMCWIALIGAPVAIVMAWLPANSRYAKALKQRA
ncbi:MAG: hypothetical protein ABW215_22025 [Kibdelosporangium sp.]